MQWDLETGSPQIGLDIRFYSFLIAYGRSMFQHKEFGTNPGKERGCFFLAKTFLVFLQFNGYNFTVPLPKRSTFST
jgi:hypothetical protein